jgi:fructan beta-fructosidase
MIKKSVYILSIIMLMVVFMFASTSQSDIVTKGLVAYWSFDASTIKGDNVKDTVGENDGVMKSGPKQVAGKINGALQFDGTNSVDVAGTDDLNFNKKEEFTAAAWIKPASDEPVGSAAVAPPTACCGTVIGQRDALGWALRYDGRNAGAEYEFIVCPNWQGDGGFGASKKDIPKDTWHYITVMVSKDNPPNMFVYLDGELITEGTFAGPITSTGPETDIGKAADGAFVGIIDEVAIYNRALTENEIKQNFQSIRFFAVNSNEKLAICWGNIKK